MRVCLCLSLCLYTCGPGSGGDAVETSSSGETGEAETDTDTEAGTETGIATETGDEPDCDGVCVKIPPQPWRGPLAIAHEGDSVLPSVCITPPYDTQIAVFGHELVGKDDPCECRCDPPWQTECQANMNVYVQSACGGVGTPDTTPATCAWIDGGSIQVHEPMLEDPTCAPSAELPSVEWNLHTIVCEGAPEPLDACESGLACAPDPGPGLDPVVCYWALGDVECPAGFPIREVVWSAVDDQRSCADGCQCVGSGSCSGGVQLHDRCGQPPDEGVTVLPGECAEIPDLGFPPAITNRFTIDHDCLPPILTVPILGSLSEDAPQTICCVGTG